MAAQLLQHISSSEQSTPSLLYYFIPLGNSTLSSFYLTLDQVPPHSYTILPPCQPNSYLILPPLNKFRPHSCTIYPHWQPKSNIILPPLNKLPPRSYTILSPLAAQLLHHFTPSEQIAPSLLHHFIPLGSSTFSSLYIPLDKSPLQTFKILPPLGSPTLTTYFVL